MLRPLSHFPNSSGWSCEPSIAVRALAATGDPSVYRCPHRCGMHAAAPCPGADEFSAGVRGRRRIADAQTDCHTRGRGHADTSPPDTNTHDGSRGHRGTHTRAGTADRDSRTPAADRRSRTPAADRRSPTPAADRHSGGRAADRHSRARRANRHSRAGAARRHPHACRAYSGAADDRNTGTESAERRTIHERATAVPTAGGGAPTRARYSQGLIRCARRTRTGNPVARGRCVRCRSTGSVPGARCCPIRRPVRLPARSPWHRPGRCLGDRPGRDAR